MSMDSAKMADLILNDLFDENGNSKLKADAIEFKMVNNGSKMNVDAMEFQPSSLQLPNLNATAPDQKEQDIPSESWIITAFNLLIEYIPYKHVMEEIFLCCNANLNDAIHSDLEYPNTSDFLQCKSKSAIHRIHDWFANVYLFFFFILFNQTKITKKGAPGSGKSSYANYRYGSENVFAADDYFDLFHDGKFIGSKLSLAHEWCTKQVFARIQLNKTVIIANTNSNLWQLHNKIVPIMFNSFQIHKIVFAVMPEQNPSTLVKRCLHKVSKLKISEYCNNITYMLSGIGKNRSMHINVAKILKYGHMNDPNDQSIKSRKNMIEYGIFLENDTFIFLQDWFVQQTKCKYDGNDIGDGRISPLVIEHWHVFKKRVQKLDRFNYANDPIIDLKIKIVGYANHSLCKMVKIEIIKTNLQNHKIDKIKARFWKLFEAEVDLQSMGCVLSMKSGIPFTNAKHCIIYDRFEYIEDGLIINAKLTTKRRAIKSFGKRSKEKRLNPNVNEFKMQNNDFLNPNASEFTYGESEEMEQQILNASAPEFVMNGNSKLKADAKEFNLAMEYKQNKALSPNAIEFKMENNGSKMNVDALEFQPSFLKLTNLSAAAAEFKLNGHL